MTLYLKAYKETRISSPERENEQFHVVCLRMERGESELLNICSVAAKEGDRHLQWAKHHAKYSRETKRTKSLGSGGWSR